MRGRKTVRGSNRERKRGSEREREQHSERGERDHCESDRKREPYSFTANRPGDLITVKHCTLPLRLIVGVKTFYESNCAVGARVWHHTKTVSPFKTNPQWPSISPYIVSACLT